MAEQHRDRLLAAAQHRPPHHGPSTLCLASADDAVPSRDGWAAAGANGRRTRPAKLAVAGSTTYALPHVQRARVYGGVSNRARGRAWDRENNAPASRSCRPRWPGRAGLALRPGVSHVPLVALRSLQPEGHGVNLRFLTLALVAQLHRGRSRLAEHRRARRG